MADLRLPADEQRLATATKRAVQAAGGLKVCEAETGKSDSQLSRCCSTSDPNSVTIRDAVRIDAIGRGERGHPHILNAMADLLGAVVIMLPEAGDTNSSLQMSVLELTSELGDVSRAIAASFSSDSAGGAQVTTTEAEAALDQVADLERSTAKLRHLLERLANGSGPSP